MKSKLVLMFLCVLVLGLQGVEAQEPYGQRLTTIVKKWYDMGGGKKEFQLLYGIRSWNFDETVATPTGTLMKGKPVEKRSQKLERTEAAGKLIITEIENYMELYYKTLSGADSVKTHYSRQLYQEGKLISTIESPLTGFVFTVPQSKEVTVR